MGDSSSVPVLIALVLVFSFACKKALQRSASTPNLPYPPGPKPNFFLGNILDFPTKDAPKVYAEWGKQYQSGIIYVNVLGTHIVILNRLEDAKELLDKRSRIYSDRPPIPMADLMGWDFALPMMRYGERWRSGRKIFQQHLRKEGMGQLEPVHVQKVNDMLRGLLLTPEDYEAHGRIVPAAITMKLAYGYDCSSMHDPFVALAEEGMTAASHYVLPHAALVNIFPILRHVPSWFPGAEFKRVGERISKVTAEMKDAPVEYVKKKMAAGTAVPCMVSQLLEEGGSDEMEQEVKEAAATMYSAALDTVFAAITGFIYAMVRHQDIQRKAQIEIDRVVGTDRLPNYQDRESLSYVEAIYRELMRWRPPVPLAIPHASIEDDIYNGYFIPKGTIVMPNIWQMTHDPEKYLNPDDFFPERFFDEQGKLNDDNEILAYGFGRRVCVGHHAASSIMWLIIVSTLAAFNITKKKDENGREIDIDDTFTDTGISRKTAMECSIKPRSEKAKKLVEETKYLVE